MKTWFDIKAAAGGEKQTEVMIFDEIGLWGVTAKDFATALKEIPEDHAITVRINSPGGSVFDGYAIFNALKARSAQITTKIEGLAASMASVIALAGSKVTAAANSIVMIHNPWSGVSGDSDDLRKMADLLDKLTGQLVGIYAAKTGLPEADVRAAMDAETWFTGAEAQEWGLVDEVTDEIQAVASFDVSRFRNAPKALAEKPAPIAAEPQQPDAIATITAERDELKAKLETVETQAAHSAEQIAALKVESDQRASAIDAEKAAHALTKAQLDESRAELLRRDAEIAVGSAIASGRLAETARADFVSRYVKNADDTKAILAALPVARGNAPVPPESKEESAPDAAIYSEYRALKGKARDDFFAKHKDAIWRAAGSQ